MTVNEIVCVDETNSVCDGVTVSVEKFVKLCDCVRVFVIVPVCAGCESETV